VIAMYWWNILGFGHIGTGRRRFMLPYWLAETFIPWNNLLAWKWLHLASLVPCCIAGMIAAFYVAIYPGMCSVVLATSAFDTIHVTAPVASMCCFGVSLYKSGRMRIGRKRPP